MRKLSEINEGILSKTIKRSKTDEIRLEDRVKTNISEFTEIDLGEHVPILFADMDLSIDDNNELSYEDFKEHKKYIESTGWRLPYFEEIFEDNFLPLTVDGNKFIDVFFNKNNREDSTHITFKSKENNNKLKISFHDIYGLIYLCPSRIKTKTEICKTFRINNPYYLNFDLITPGWGVLNKKYKIRLVKDKK